MWRALLTALLVLVPCAGASAASLVDVQAPPATLERLGLDVTHDGSVVLHGPRDAAALRDAGYPYETLVADLDGSSARARAGTRRGASSLPTARSDYRDLTDYEEEMRLLEEANPGLVRRSRLSRTTADGNPITALEIASDVNAAGDGRPVYAVFGLHHAREWPSGEVVLELAHDLVASYGEARIRSLLDRVRVVLIPVVNPDGFVHSRTVDPSWRKNSVSRAVDLNRNYAAGWGGSGSSSSPLSPSYRGPSPFSEAESAAVHAFSQTRQLTNVQSVHTKTDGDVLRQPGFGEYGTVAPDEPRMKALGDAMGAATGYRSRTALAFQEIHGATEDWNYIAQGAFGYTIELGPAGSNDFHGPYDTHVVAEYPKVREALLLAGEQAADPADHAVLAGAAPAGWTLRLRRDFLTGTLCGGCAPIADFVDTTLEVAASGRFEWHVGPSTRPWSKAPEAWRLTCTDPTGAERARRDAVVVRGQRIDVGEACAPPPAPAGAPGPAAGGPGAGPPPTASPAARRVRLAVTRIRVRRSTLARRRALVASLRLSGGALRDVRLRLRRGRTTVASRRIARVRSAGRVRLPLARVPRAGTYRLSVRGVTAAGARVGAMAAVEIRR